jgi:hypothetical protein
MVVDMLAILINRAKDLGQVIGVVPHLVDGGLSILQYADDTIIFMEDDLERAKNMKLVLCAFEQLLGLKNNFHKSKLFRYGADKGLDFSFSSSFSRHNRKFQQHMFNSPNDGGWLGPSCA